MTPNDKALNPGIFLENDPLVLHRLAKTKYANLSGAGAALVPGRWNRLTQEALYTSTEMGVPVLERLAHTPKDVLPDGLSMMTIAVRGKWRRESDRLIDETDGAVLRWFTTLRAAFEGFAQEQFESFAVAVPSVIVPVWNVVLFPDAPGFWEHVSVTEIEPFTFDPRLFP